MTTPSPIAIPHQHFAAEWLTRCIDPPHPVSLVCDSESSPERRGDAAKTIFTAHGMRSIYLWLPFIPRSSKRGGARKIGLSNRIYARPDGFPAFRRPIVYQDERVAQQKRAITVLLEAAASRLHPRIRAEWWRASFVFVQRRSDDKRGDCANLHHLVLDAAEGVLWRNDVQVISLHIDEVPSKILVGMAALFQPWARRDAW